MNSLPYIPLDEEFSLNIGILAIILENLSKNRNGNAVLDIDKAQFFMYLMKNPAKIEKVMLFLGKKIPVIDEKETHTIKSLSNNVDILFDNKKIKTILKTMAIRGLLDVERYEEKSYLKLSGTGEDFARSLNGDFFVSIRNYSESLDSLKSLPSSKLYKILNEVFMEAE